MTSCAAARLTAPCGAEECCGQTVPRPKDRRAGLRRAVPWRSRLQPALNAAVAAPRDLFPAKETLHTHEMPGTRLAHPSRVTLKVPLAAGRVLGSTFEKSKVQIWVVCFWRWDWVCRALAEGAARLTA